MLQVAPKYLNSEADAETASEMLHRRLAALNQARFTPAKPAVGWEEALAERMVLLREEHWFLENERRAIRERAHLAPREPDGFMAWFEELEADGPGQHDPLFSWLATTASLDQMSWFLTQEVAGEAGFDDLVAVTQVRMPIQPKLELARNYWDEMGRGNPKGMHGPMLHDLTIALDLRPRVETTVWESLALANTMAGLAADRHYAYHSIGALGAIELTGPGRSIQVARGLKRLGVRAPDRHYFDLHAVIDVRHSEAWNQEVIRPLIENDPQIGVAIAEGALMRLNCGARCFERYRREFRL
jgi:hypothetical protein